MAMKAMMAIQLLDALGCGNDPIYYKQELMDPFELEYALSRATNGREQEAHASRVRIEYFHRPSRLKSGTLLQMVRDRFNDTITGRT